MRCAPHSLTHMCETILRGQLWVVGAGGCSRCRCCRGWVWPAGNLVGAGCGALSSASGGRMFVCCCVDSKLLEQCWLFVVCDSCVRVGKLCTRCGMLHQQHELHCLRRMVGGSRPLFCLWQTGWNCAQLCLQLIAGRLFCRQVESRCAGMWFKGVQECGTQKRGDGCCVQPGYGVICGMLMLGHEGWCFAGSSLQVCAVTNHSLLYLQKCLERLLSQL